MSFDPTQHNMLPARDFSEFSIGEVFFAPSRTMTAATFAAFQAVSGDNHPIHYDRTHLERQSRPGLMAHGFQTLAQAAIGACPLAHQMGTSLIGFLDQSSRFLAPVYEGDTLFPEFEITAMEQRDTTGTMTLTIRIHNQNSVCVCDGHQTYLLRLRDPKIV
ncbi:MAG: MaoC family dehydratase [Paracoccaceae bacterium]